MSKGKPLPRAPQDPAPSLLNALTLWGPSCGGFLLPAAGSLWYILASRVPPSWDDGAYLEISFHLWDRLAHGRILSFLYGFSEALGFKAPLITLLPFPAFLVAGKGMAQAQIAGLGALAALSFYSWRIGSLLRPPWGGPLAVWLVNLTPLVYGLSRHFYVETLLAALCAAAVYHLLAGGGRRALGAILGLGLLCKLAFPIYIAVPVATLAFRRRTLRDWLWIAGIAAAIASVWYGRNLGSALRFARSAGYGATGQAGEGAARMAAYVRVVLEQGWGWPLLSLLAAVAALALLGLLERPDRERLRELAALAGWAALPCVFFSSGLTPDPRWCGPALAGASVALAVLGATAIERAPERVRPALALAALLPAAAVYAEQTFGVRLFPRPGKRVPAYVWNGPPETGGFWGQKELWSLIAKDAAATPGVKGVVLFPQHRHFNPNTAGVYANLDGWPLRFHAFNRYPSPEHAILFVETSGAEYLTLVDGLPEGELDKQLNRHNASVLAAIEKGVLPFKQWAAGGLPNGAQAYVFKRAGRGLRAPHFLGKSGDSGSKKR